jgi:hypothetical protein
MPVFDIKSVRLARDLLSQRRQQVCVRGFAAALLLLSIQLTFSYAWSQTTDSRAAVARASTEVLQNILDGIAQGDFAKYSKDFAPDMKASQTREAFLALQKKIQSALGRLKSLHYLGSYSQGGNVIQLFKANFTKHRDDVLIKLVLEAKKSKPLVTGLWLDSPALEK